MSLKHRLDTQEGVAELTMQIEGERVTWERRSPGLRRNLTVYLDVLTPEQRQRLEVIEKELLEMAYDADEEVRTKTVLKSQKRPKPEDIDKRLSTPIPPISADLTKRLEKNVADIDKLLHPEANDQAPGEEEK
jgi:hypothetical protein